MFILLLLTALAGQGTIKGNKLLDDGQPALLLKTQKIPGGVVAVTATSPDGAPVLVMSLTPVPPAQKMLNADFQGLGVNFGGLIADTTPDDLLLAWWGAGVLTAQGADRAALGTWAAANKLTLRDTAAEQQKLADYAATHPGPTFSSPSSSASSSSAASATSSSKASSAPAAPTTVSVNMKITCNPKVRVFFGDRPNASGTYGWESYNSVRSTTVKAGSVICVADERDHVQSCWTASGSSARIEIGCGGITQK